MASEDIALMAHLMRRAGFGASREELEARAARGYEATVEELVKKFGKKWFFDPRLSGPLAPEANRNGG